jgi:hypothetical protein
LQKLKGRNHLGDKGVNRDNIKMYLTDTGSEYMDWIHLAQDRVQWQVVVNMVVNLVVP